MSIYTLCKALALVYIKRVEERRAEHHRLNHHHKPHLVNRKAELNSEPMLRVSTTAWQTASTLVYYKSGGERFSSHHYNKFNGRAIAQRSSLLRNTRGNPFLGVEWINQTQFLLIEFNLIVNTTHYKPLWCKYYSFYLGNVQSLRY